MCRPDCVSHHFSTACKKFSVVWEILKRSSIWTLSAHSPDCRWYRNPSNLPESHTPHAHIICISSFLRSDSSPPWKNTLSEVRMQHGTQSAHSLVSEFITSLFYSTYITLHFCYLATIWSYIILFVDPYKMCRLQNLWYLATWIFPPNP